ncbi:hypothetical protein LguiA_033220 [Lonicera macranthoides]
MNLESMWGEDNINSSDEANLQFEDDELDSDEEGTVHNESSDGDIIRYQTSFEHFEEDGESLMRLFNKGSTCNSISNYIARREKQSSSRWLQVFYNQVKGCTFKLGNFFTIPTGDIRADRRLNITVISSEVFEEASRGNGAVKLAVYKVPTVSDGSIEVDMGDSGEVDSSIFLDWGDLAFLYSSTSTSLLLLVRQLQGQEGDVAGEKDPATPKKIFQLLNQAANDCNIEAVAYEFFTQPFMLYEEEVAIPLLFRERNSTDNKCRNSRLCRINKKQSDTNTQDSPSDAFFASTLQYIQFQKQKGGAMGEKYDPIKA